MSNSTFNPMQEWLKISIVGAVNTGKTSLVNRYVDPESQWSEGGIASTIGADFKTKNEAINGASKRLLIWDTSGQERFLAITREYFRGSNAVILAYDMTDSDALIKAQKWLLELHRHVGHAVTIFLVGTKQDLVAADASKCAVSAEALQQFIQENSTEKHPIVLAPEVSAKNNVGISELFETIAEHADSVLNIKKSAAKAKLSDDDEQEVTFVASRANDVKSGLVTFAKFLIASFLIGFVVMSAAAFLVSTFGVGLGLLMAGGALGAGAASYLAVKHCCAPKPFSEVDSDTMSQSRLGTYNRFADVGLYDSVVGDDVPGMSDSGIGEQVKRQVIYEDEWQVPLDNSLPATTASTPGLRRNSDNE